MQGVWQPAPVLVMGISALLAGCTATTFPEVAPHTWVLPNLTSSKASISEPAITWPLGERFLSAGRWSKHLNPAACHHALCDGPRQTRGQPLPADLAEAERLGAGQPDQ